MTDVVHVGAYGAPAAVGDMPMNGKICVITGATSGIGRATVLGLAKLGAKS